LELTVDDSLADFSSFISDTDLMKQVQAGETEQFAQLVGRYRRAMNRVAESRLGNHHLAEEVVQETFLSAYRSRHTYLPRFSFRTWLWTILLNQCRQTGAKAARSPKSVSSTAGEGDRGWQTEIREPADARQPGPLNVLLAKERSEVLERLLGRLSTVQADALRLRFFGGLTFQEVADTMGTSLLTARNRVQAGLLRLAEMLKEN
jgi:RNA polymerase sigma-70 factor (ECF subfamily)